ncbi:MAG: hypothetical protein KGZ82_11575 [Bacteroidales bacterium]|nr:hypothetical protein [Bacteroidales bacterium]
MTDKTAVDLLFDNLTAKGMQPEKRISERNFVVPGKDRMSNTKYVIARHHSLFFCAYDSHGTSAYASRTFTGMYSSINLPPETDCHIYKKDWVDLLLRYHKRKSGLSYLDDTLTITSATDWTPAGLLSRTDAGLFLALNDKIEPLKITIQHDYLSIIEELKGKTVIGIETDLWLYKENDLDAFIQYGGQLIENMTNACALQGQSHRLDPEA